MEHVIEGYTSSECLEVSDYVRLSVCSLFGVWYINRLGSVFHSDSYFAFDSGLKKRWFKASPQVDEVSLNELGSDCSTR